LTRAIRCIGLVDSAQIPPPACSPAGSLSSLSTPAGSLFSLSTPAGSPFSLSTPAGAQSWLFSAPDVVLQAGQAESIAKSHFEKT
jgi:hypothetical protein